MPSKVESLFRRISEDTYLKCFNNRKYFECKHVCISHIYDEQISKPNCGIFIFVHGKEKRILENNFNDE